MKRVCLWCLLLCSLALVAVLTGCKGSASLISSWRSVEIRVDGVDSEWSSPLFHFEDENVVIGLRNDADNLYVVLKGMDRKRHMQVMRAGFTVWLDATGKNKKTLGIRYPIGMQAYGIPAVKSEPGTEFDEEQRKKLAEMMGEIEILGPEKSDRNRAWKSNPYGIEVELGDTLGAMIYELKIPLKPTDDSPYAIFANAGDVISLGLETGEMSMGDRGGHPPMGGGMPGGRGGQGGMGGGGKRGGPPGGGMGEGIPQPIKLWAKVSLTAPVTEEE
ncbi:MAG: hypothetical protein WBC98_02640 [Candidatus Zixiibacteriota bacterium]